MKTVGVVGGIGPESTVEYYRVMVASYQEQRPDGSYPPIIINSIDLKKMLDLIAAGELAEVTEYLAGEVRKLERAGADFGLLAAGTPHVVFDGVSRQSSLPLLSIVEATREEAKALGLKRLGLFGTLFTMRGRFYPDVFSEAELELVTPEDDEQRYIHDKYMGELVKGVSLPETRERLLAIAARMKEQEGIEGLILGGTELSLILRGDGESPVPLLDTTRIHAKAAVARMLS